MAHGKETPRQKMIGMMYLVLMAMLALNVSNEVLKAFAVLDEGLSSTKGTIEQTNSIVFDNISQENNMNPTKAGQWFDLAKKIKDDADEIVNFIESNKIEILKKAGEDTAEVFVNGRIMLENIKAKDKTDAPAMVMIGDNDDKAAKELKSKIDNFREYLMRDVVKDASKDLLTSIENSLDTKEGVDSKSGEKIDWTRGHFEHLPLVGVLSIMSGLQINVRNAEAEVLKYLYGNIDKGAFKFNNLDATVIPNSSYIIRGNEYRAEIFLAASDTTAPSKAYISDGKYPYDSTINADGSYTYTAKPGALVLESNRATGKAYYKAGGGGLGMRYWGGIIEMVGPNNVKITKPFKRSYMVAEGGVVVSPTKMNVFYLGVDNPVDVSVAGIAPDKISIDVTNASTTATGNSSYIVRPKRPGNSFVTVYAVVDGSRREMDKKEFRVKKVPDPVPKVNGISSGGISKNVLLAQVGVAAEMENFDFDLKFTVTEFVVSTNVGGFLKEASSNSYKFTKEQKNIIDMLNKGQRVYIQDIKAVGPDGTPRPLPAVALLISN